MVTMSQHHYHHHQQQQEEDSPHPTPSRLHAPKAKEPPKEEKQGTAPSPSRHTTTTTTTRPQISDFWVGDVIGRGRWATVYYAKPYHPLDWKNGISEMAIKVMDMVTLQRQSHLVEGLQREVSILASLASLSSLSSCVVPLYMSFHDDVHLYLVLELALGGTLAHFVVVGGRARHRQQRRFYALQVVGALEWIHSQGVIHCDLKPENVGVFWNKTTIADKNVESNEFCVTLKLLDFDAALYYSRQERQERQGQQRRRRQGQGLGLQRLLDGAVPQNGKENKNDKDSTRRSNTNTNTNTNTTTTANTSTDANAPLLKGTTAYMSPEMIRGTPGWIDPAVDLWALGCLMHAMKHGASPFESCTEQETLCGILQFGTSSLEDDNDKKNGDNDNDNEESQLVGALLQPLAEHRLGYDNDAACHDDKDDKDDDDDEDDDKDKDKDDGQDKLRYTSIRSHPYFCCQDATVGDNNDNDNNNDNDSAIWAPEWVQRAASGQMALQRGNRYLPHDWGD